MSCAGMPCSWPPVCMGLRADCALQVEEMQRRDSERNERLQEVQTSLAQREAEVAQLQAANAQLEVDGQGR